MCRALPNDNPYQRLASYVAQYQEPTIVKVEDLPLVSGRAVPIIGYVLDPHNPQHNRMTLRRFLSSCRDRIWWFDPYFTDAVLDLLRDVVDDPEARLREIHLVTTTEQLLPSKTTKGVVRKPAVTASRVSLLQGELQRKGIAFELRQTAKWGLHDRFLFHPGGAVNMPPFNGAIGVHEYVSEYATSNVSADWFSELWMKARPLEAI